jgi:gliding motility-associated-like protein
VLGDYVTLSTNLSGTGTTVDFLWTPSDYNISSATSPSPVVNPFENTVYCVTATDLQGGCISTACIEIEVISDVVIPNAFSPNADGINDYFHIPDLGDLCDNVNSFQIYDRWGELVYDYQNDLLQTGWDGTHVGSNVPMPVGTYVYVLTLQCGIEQRIFASDLVLLR